MSEQQPSPDTGKPISVCEVHGFYSWVRPCPHCRQSLRDELLTALLEHHNYDSLYARCMELVERYQESK